MLVFGALKSGIPTMIAGTESGWIGYGAGRTDPGYPGFTAGSFLADPAFFVNQGKTTEYLYTSGTDLFLFVHGGLTGTSGKRLNVGAQSYAFADAARVNYGGPIEYKWTGATALTDGTSYRVSVT